jgi:PAS domain S-box-containing protein
MKQLQNAHFQQIIDSAMDAIISVDEAQIIFMFNKAAEQMFGYDAASILGQNLDILIPGRYRAEHRSYVHKFGKTASTSRRMGGLGKIYGLHAQGHEFPLEASISHIHSENGKIYTVILRDITERIRTEEIVAQRLKLEDTLSKMAASTPGVFIVYQAKSADSGDLVYVSPNITEIFGPAAANLKGGSHEWIKMIHPDDREKATQTAAVALGNGRIAPSIEYRVLHPTRGEIWIESRRNMEKLPDGTVRIYSYVSEITGRKKQELALQQSERQLREILDNMTEGYQIIGFDWRYKFFNNAFVKQSRHSVEELMSQTVQELYPGIEQTEVYRAYQRCFSERISIRMENEFRFPDGSLGWFALFFQPTARGLSILSVDITDRKRHELALNESERQLNAAMRISGLGSFELDLTTGLVAASPKLLEIFGMQPGGTFKREDFYRLIHPEDRARVQQASEAALRGEKPFNEEYRILRDDGQPRWLNARAEVTTDGKGMRRYTGAVIDITEQKTIQENLRGSEERFREVVENIEEVFWMTDVVKKTILYISPAYEKIWGRSVQSLFDEPRQWLEAIHPGDRQRILDALPGQKEGKYNEEYRVVRPDGSIAWISDKGFPIRNSEGVVYRIAGVAQDITERKKLKTELSRFVELSPTVLYAIRVAADGLHSTWRSQNLATLTGYDPSDPELNKAHWWVENIHADDRVRVLDAHRLPYEIDHQVIEYRLRKKDGVYIWIRDEKRLFRDAAGNPLEIVGSWSDITERLHLETQMRQAQKMEAIGQLAAGVAHDFNNLLTVIKGNNDLIKADASMATETREWCHDIELATEKASYLTQQLLLVGRRQSLQLKPLELNETLRQNATLLSRMLGEHIEIQFHAADVSLNVYADPGMISQIILNLSVNARDAMPSGGVLSLKCTETNLDEATAHSIPQARPGKYACISVSDTGTGISQEILSRIFEPFFTTKETGKGTGLGLATVFGIVQQHQGWVNVYSEQGHGTTFRIYLPLIHGSLAKETKTEIHTTVEIGQETILVVEDQLALRKLARTILSKLGYHVLDAGTGKEALAIWEQQSELIDLVISDIIMPDGMNGFELAKRLQLQKADLKIIFTSGYSPDLLSLQDSLAQGSAFLPKPYSLADLSRIVRTSLDADKHS